MLYNTTCLICQRLITQFFVDPGKIPIIGKHFRSSNSPLHNLSIRLIFHHFLSQKSTLFGQFVILLLLLMFSLSCFKAVTFTASVKFKQINDAIAFNKTAKNYYVQHMGGVRLT